MDGGGKAQRDHEGLGEEGFGEAALLGCDAAKMLHLAEHTMNGVAFPVQKGGKAGHQAAIDLERKSSPQFAPSFKVASV